jgi:hypothetical protein
MLGTTRPLLVAIATPMLCVWCCSSAAPPGSRHVLSAGKRASEVLSALMMKGR